MPPRPVLALLLVLATAPPFVAQATDSVVGSFTMFDEISSYHVALSAVTDTGTRQVRLKSLARQLSPEAQAILLPADGVAIGADQVDVIAAGLGDLARLVCRVHRDARAAHAELSEGPSGSTPKRVRAATVDCAGLR
jgi:hypothetical protein